MAKNETLKQRLKQAAKRRAKRAGRHTEAESGHDKLAGHGGSAAQGKSAGSEMDLGESGAAVPNGGKRTKVQAAVDVLVHVILTCDRQGEPLRDRDVLGALRSMQRGFASSEASVQALFDALVVAKQESELETYALRRAVNQLLELMQSYDAVGRESRAALDYLHSIAS